MSVVYSDLIFVLSFYQESAAFDQSLCFFVFGLFLVQRRATVLFPLKDDGGSGAS